VEIVPFLRLTGARLALLIVAALAAGGFGAFVASNRPTEYRGRADVYADRVYPDGGAQAMGNLLTTYTSSGTVQRAAADAAGAGLDEAIRSLSAAVPPNSSIISITYVNANPAAASAGAEAAARAGLQELVDAEVESTAAALDRAEVALATAQARTRELSDPFQVSDLRRLLTDTENSIRSLESSVAQTQPDDERLPQFQASLAAAIELRATLVEMMPTWDDAASQLDLAKREADDARRRSLEATDRLGAIASDAGVEVRETGAVSRTQLLLRFAVACAVAVIALLLAAFTLIEALRRRRPARSPERTSDTDLDLPRPPVAEVLDPQPSHR
jgi:hypothetical protein